MNDANKPLNLDRMRDPRELALALMQSVYDLNIPGTQITRVSPAFQRHMILVGMAVGTLSRLGDDQHE